MSSAGLPTTRLNAPNDRWEYHVVYFNVSTLLFGPEIKPDEMRERLDAAGADGWELVNTVDVNRGRGNTSELIFIFKRLYRPDRYVRSAAT